MYDIREVNSALKKALLVYRIQLVDVEQPDKLQLLNSAVFDMMANLDEARRQKHSKGIKFYMSLALTFYQAANPSVITNPAVVFNSEAQEYFEGSDIQQLLENAYRQLRYEIDLYERNGSGWVLDELIQLDTAVLEMDPLRASTYIPSPDFIRHKKAVLNIKTPTKNVSCGQLLLDFIQNRMRNMLMKPTVTENTKRSSTWLVLISQSLLIKFHDSSNRIRSL